MLIDRLLPSYDVWEEHAIVIAAPAEHVYQAIRRTDLSRSPLIRGLFAARGLPRLLRQRRTGGRSLTLDDFLRAGFVLLAEEPGVELVLGVVGTFWRPTGGVLPLTPDAFEPFAEPGYAKAVWSFHVAPRGPSQTRVTTITRVVATDPRSRRKFLRYWRVIGPFSGVVRREMLRLLRAEVQPGGTQPPPHRGS